MIDLKKLESGDIRTLAKAITLIESSKISDINEVQKIFANLKEPQKSSLRIGITGAPGAGKSTFIENLGLHLTNDLKKKVAVLAIDPSSPVQGGSILGDKTRMDQLSQSSLAYVRPSPSKGDLGGITRSTRNTILLCEAAGFDIIIIESVGVGQSELELSHLVDVMTLLLLPGAGDDIQGIKKGIVEVADLFIVNKADGDQYKLATKTAKDFLTTKPLHTFSSIGEKSNSNSTINDIFESIGKLTNDQKKLINNRKKHFPYLLKSEVKSLINLTCEQKLKDPQEMNNLLENINSEKDLLNLARKIVSDLIK